jgi:hypothetical protein
MISDSVFDFEVLRSQLAKQESALAKIGSGLAILDCGLEQIRVALANLESAFGKTQARLLSVLSQLTLQICLLKPAPNLFRNSSYLPRRIRRSARFYCNPQNAATPRGKGVTASDTFVASVLA